MIENDIQKLELGAFVELFELDASNIGGPVLRFHGYQQSTPIWWQGNEFSPWSIQATGFAKNGEGQQATPSLLVGNIGLTEDGHPLPGVISSLCIELDDLVGARLIRHRTLGKYLDAANFPEGNPSADPDEYLPPEIWIVEAKTNETPEAVEFELASALDFNGQQLPGNKILASYCLALSKGGYRGYWCGYTGSNMFDLNDQPVSDPTLDKCAGRVSSCKLRFGEWEQINFVGAPSADRVRGY